MTHTNDLTDIFSLLKHVLAPTFYKQFMLQEFEQALKENLKNNLMEASMKEEKVKDGSKRRSDTKKKRKNQTEKSCVTCFSPLRKSTENLSSKKNSLYKEKKSSKSSLNKSSIGNITSSENQSNLPSFKTSKNSICNNTHYNHCEHTNYDSNNDSFDSYNDSSILRNSKRNSITPSPSKNSSSKRSSSGYYSSHNQHQQHLAKRSSSGISLNQQLTAASSERQVSSRVDDSINIPKIRQRASTSAAKRLSNLQKIKNEANIDNFEERKLTTTRKKIDKRNFHQPYTPPSKPVISPSRPQHLQPPQQYMQPKRALSLRISIYQNPYNAQNIEYVNCENYCQDTFESFNNNNGGFSNNCSEHCNNNYNNINAALSSTPRHNRHNDNNDATVKVLQKMWMETIPLCVDNDHIKRKSHVEKHYDYEPRRFSRNDEYKDNNYENDSESKISRKSYKENDEENEEKKEVHDSKTSFKEKKMHRVDRPRPPLRRLKGIDEIEKSYNNNLSETITEITNEKNIQKEPHQTEATAKKRLSNYYYLDYDRKQTNEEVESCQNVKFFDTTIIVNPNNGRRYRRGRFLGKGGFATCYEFTELTTNAVYAVKIVSKQLFRKPHQKNKISTEIKLHSKMKHENVVNFHEDFEDEHNVFMVLELCSRKSLEDILKRRGCVTEPEARYYMRQIVDGCRYIHSKKIIHRDLKLANMLINGAMNLKIGDFGLATQVALKDTRKKSVCGTPNYVAPEVIKRGHYSFEVDMWSIGCILYTLLSGNTPFETHNLKDTYRRITTASYSFPAHFSTQAKSVISRLLDLNPENRLNLDQLLYHDFFTCGFSPSNLPPSACFQKPKFAPSSSVNRAESVKALKRSSNNENKLFSKLKKRFSSSHNNIKHKDEKQCENDDEKNQKENNNNNNKDQNKIKNDRKDGEEHENNNNIEKNDKNNKNKGNNNNNKDENNDDGNDKINNEQIKEKLKVKNRTFTEKNMCSADKKHDSSDNNDINNNNDIMDNNGVNDKVEDNNNVDFVQNDSDVHNNNVNNDDNDDINGVGDDSEDEDEDSDKEIKVKGTVGRKVNLNKKDHKTEKKTSSIESIDLKSQGLSGNDSDDDDDFSNDDAEKTKVEQSNKIGQKNKIIHNEESKNIDNKKDIKNINTSNTNNKNNKKYNKNKNNNEKVRIDLENKKAIVKNKIRTKTKSVKTMKNNRGDDNEGRKSGVEKDSVKLYKKLQWCLPTMHLEKAAKEADGDVKEVVYVTRWVDFSNKFGFGFCLSNRNIGLIFNDDTKLMSNRKSLKYVDSENNTTILNPPLKNITKNIKSKVAILNFVTSYMLQKLKATNLSIISGDSKTSSFDSGSFDEATSDSSDSDLKTNTKTRKNYNKKQTNRHADKEIYVSKWYREGDCVLMYLSNGTYQMNNCSDHTKLVVSPMECDHLLTFLSTHPTSSHHQDQHQSIANINTVVRLKLSDVAKLGCSIHQGNMIKIFRRKLYQLINFEIDW